MAREWQRLLKDGIDPRDVLRRKRAEAEQRSGDTFAKLAELYIAHQVGISDPAKRQSGSPSPS